MRRCYSKPRPLLIVFQNYDMARWDVLAIDPISRWLNHVDEQVPPDAGVETLKLALYPFIKTKYAEAQALQKPSQVYHFLEKYFEHSKQKALQWFVHALCCLKSPQSRGRYLVGSACQKRYEITLPHPPKADDIDVELRFCECLAIICDKAQGAELEGKLKKEFSKKGILDTNPQHLSHLPQMFFRLIQKKKLGPKNTKRLIRTLEKQYQSDDDDAVTRWCQFYLNEYLISAGMPQIPSMQGVTRDQLGPETSDFENPTATELSSDQGESPMRRPLKGEGQSVAKLCAEQVGPTHDLYVYSPYKPMGDPGVEKTTTLDQSQGSDDLEDHAPGLNRYSPQSSRSRFQSAERSRRRCFCILLCVVFGVLIVVANALLGGLVWRNLFIRPKFDTFISEDAMVIVGELNNYYHQEVQYLSWLNDSQFADHVIEVYAFDSSCNSLPTTAKVIMTSCEESNISETRNFNRLYLLPGSTLSYTITPNRDVNGSNSIKGHIYITFGPEIHSFNPNTCHGTNCTIEEDKALNFTDQENIENVYRVKKRGYYNVHIFIPQGQIYCYSFRLASIVLDANITESEHGVHKVKYTNQTIPLKFRIGKTCLVAYANTDNSSPPYSIISLEARVTKLQTVMVLVTTAVPSAVVTLVVIACVIITGCCCLGIKSCKRQLREYTIGESLSEYITIQ